VNTAFVLSQQTRTRFAGDGDTGDETVGSSANGEHGRALLAATLFDFNVWSRRDPVFNYKLEITKLQITGIVESESHWTAAERERLGIRPQCKLKKTTPR
jgi:hypothetical protein